MSVESSGNKNTRYILGVYFVLFCSVLSCCCAIDDLIYIPILVHQTNCMGELFLRPIVQSTYSRYVLRKYRVSKYA